MFIGRYCARLLRCSIHVAKQLCSHACAVGGVTGQDGRRVSQFRDWTETYLSNTYGTAEGSVTSPGTFALVPRPRRRGRSRPSRSCSHPKVDLNLYLEANALDIDVTGGPRVTVFSHPASDGRFAFGRIPWTTSMYPWTMGGQTANLTFHWHRQR